MDTILVIAGAVAAVALYLWWTHAYYMRNMIDPSEWFKDNWW